MYTAMVIMTLYHLPKRGTWTTHRIILIYAVFMFVVTAGWCTEALLDEARPIETLAGPSPSFGAGVADKCSAVACAAVLMTALQFWCVNTLMVREHPSHAARA
jgi:hypothetical protein